MTALITCWTSALQRWVVGPSSVMIVMTASQRLYTNPSSDVGKRHDLEGVQDRIKQRREVKYVHSTSPHVSELVVFEVLVRRGRAVDVPSRFRREDIRTACCRDGLEGVEPCFKLRALYSRQRRGVL